VTGEELAVMGNVGPCELVDGRIEAMTPTGNLHSAIELNLGSELLAWVRPRKLGHVRVGEAGIYTGRNPDTVRAADILFISKERYAQRDPDSAFFSVAPDLVVEVLSPSDRWRDATRKLREYFEIGVRVVWVIDPDARSVLVHRSLTDVHELTEDEQLTGEDVLPGFSMPVKALFAE